MTEPRRNPFRSEGDAFRLLIGILAAGALVIAVALLTRPLAGAVVGLVLVAIALWRAWRWGRLWFSEKPQPSDAEGERPEPDRR